MIRICGHLISNSNYEGSTLLSASIVVSADKNKFTVKNPIEAIVLAEPKLIFGADFV